MDDVAFDNDETTDKPEAGAEADRPSRADDEEAPRRGDKKSPPIDQVIVERRTIFDDMLKPLQKMTREIGALLELESKTSQINHRDIGAKIRHAIEREGEYGANAAEQIAKYFRRETAWAYDHRNVTTKYNRKQITKLADREMSSGDHLEWSHVLQLSRVHSSSDREKLEEKTFKESLTVRQLASEVGGVSPDRGRAPGHGGRKLVKPKSLHSGLDQADTTIAMVTKKIPLWIECVTNGITDLEPAKFDVNLQRMVEKTQKSVLQLGKLLPSLIAALSKLQERCDTVMKVRRTSAEPRIDSKANRRALDRAKRFRHSRRPVAA